MNNIRLAKNSLSMKNYFLIFSLCCASLCSGAQQTIQNTDTLKAGTVKINANFTELYARPNPLTWTGSTNIVTVGTIGTGTWQGSIIAPAFLGTGSSISTKFLRGDGTWQTVATGSGTVTDLSIVTANGISGTVANSTTTPAITLTLGNITPTTVNGLTITTTTGTLTVANGQTLNVTTGGTLGTAAFTATDAYLAASVLSDTAYDATTWNGDTTHTPTKNAIRDKFESLTVGVGGSTGATDNAVIVANGTGGSTVKASGWVTAGGSSLVSATNFFVTIGSADTVVSIGGSSLTVPGSISVAGGQASMSASRTGGFGGPTMVTFAATGDGPGIEVPQISSGGTPSANSVRIYGKDVAGTAEVFVLDEAGNETQISPHSTTGPASLYDADEPFPHVTFEANYYLGMVRYVNVTRKRENRPNWEHRETFEAHNTRRGLTGAQALSALDWDTVQAAHVTRSEQVRAAWVTRRDAALGAGKPFTEVEPVLYVAKAKPAWLVAAVDRQTARQAKLVQDAADQLDRDAVKAVVNDLNNGTGTTAQRLQRVEKVLVRLIKDSYR